MKLSNLQQIICEKESELSRIRQAAADAAQHQEEEARGQMLHMVESMELKMENARQESELVIREAIHEVEMEATSSIEITKKEMEETLQHRADEIFKTANSKMEEEWALREECIRGEFETLLSTTLEDQHDKLFTHYESTIQEKDIAIKASEDGMKHKLIEKEAEHQHQMERMHQEMEVVAEEIWNDACKKFGAAADENISHSLSMADEHCMARDEQISMLLEERSELHKLLSDKEALLEKSTRDMSRMESALEDDASDIHERHEKELSQVSEETNRLARGNEHMQKALHEMECENDLLRRELTQCRLKCKTSETKYTEQMTTVSSFESEKKIFDSRVGELSACKQLLERQLSDLKSGNNELTTKSEVLNKRIHELKLVNESKSRKASTLSNAVDDLQQRNHNLERMHNDTAARVKSLKEDRREYTREMEDRMKQKDRLLAVTLDSVKTESRSRAAEPVVVHLHGNTDSNNANMCGNEKLASECNNLRSKVLQLQRENFRLESELMDLKRREETNNDSRRTSDEKKGDGKCLQQENNSLKTMISMMRKEMETVASNDASEGGEKSSLTSDLVIEQQLLQCRSYLDLLLKNRDSTDGFDSGGDEVAFLRSKYHELHRTADELREENERLHRMCNVGIGIIENDGPTVREKELIQKLEEATDEIEALLQENDKLVKLSNELRFGLQKTNGQHSSESAQLSETHRGKNKTQEYEQTMLDAILNDQSRSCDSESHGDDFEVACIGRKPPLTSAADSRPSRTAYGSRPTTASDRATTSQRQSFQRLLNRKKKEIAVEKTQIRNWNVKDPSSNPYL